MKTRLLNIYLFALAGTALMMTSCLKSSDRYIDFTQAGSMVELPLAAYLPSTHTPSLTVYKVQAQTYTQSSTPSDLQVAVNIASPEPLKSDITVTIAADPAALADLKTKIGNTTYVMVPDAGFSIPNPKVTIPAGQRTGYVTVKINSAAISKTPTTQILPISITDATGQTISKYKTIFYNIKVI